MCDPGVGKLGLPWRPWGNHMGIVFRLQFQQEPRVGGWPKREKVWFSASPFEELPAHELPSVSPHFLAVFCLFFSQTLKT